MSLKKKKPHQSMCLWVQLPVLTLDIRQGPERTSTLFSSLRLPVITDNPHQNSKELYHHDMNGILLVKRMHIH